MNLNEIQKKFKPPLSPLLEKEGTKLIQSGFQTHFLIKNLLSKLIDMIQVLTF